jgi:hypothetical protein
VHDPTDNIEEILGNRAILGFDPSSDDYLCPFINRRCVKRSTADKGNPYPVCTMRQKKTGDPVCVCPKRFYAIDFLQDVIEHAWPGPKPSNPRIASEVKMQDFGNVDFVIADTLDGEDIGQFLSVELQAIDITGSVRTAYDAVVSGEVLDRSPTYGFNWKNVYKRYINQLISKGYYHHHGGTKVVAVIQDAVYNYICNDADFMRQTDIDSPQVNIIFMSYRFDPDPANPNRMKLVLDKVEGTHHTNLQNAVLYKTAPHRDEFCQRIKEALAR